MALLALSASGLGQDNIRWGPEVQGLRLGIRISGPELIATIQNVGSEPKDVVIGSEARGFVTHYRFFATAPDGKIREGFDLSVFTGGVAGLVIPVKARIAPGTTHESTFRFKKIIFVEKAVDQTFDLLRQQGNSFHASLEVDSRTASWAQALFPWVGKMVSGEVWAN